MQEKEDIKQQQKHWREVLNGSYSAPATVFLLGVISVAMLLWYNGITNRQRQNFAVADAIMDFRIEITQSHLWIDEAINGAEDMDIRKIVPGFDRGILLAETILNGGEGLHEHDSRTSRGPGEQERNRDRDPEDGPA